MPLPPLPSSSATGALKVFLFGQIPGAADASRGEAHLCAKVLPRAARISYLFRFFSFRTLACVHAACACACCADTGRHPVRARARAPVRLKETGVFVKMLFKQHNFGRGRVGDGCALLCVSLETPRDAVTFLPQIAMHFVFVCKRRHTHTHPHAQEICQSFAFGGACRGDKRPGCAGALAL